MTVLISRDGPNRCLLDYHYACSVQCEILPFAASDYWFGLYIPQERARGANRLDFPMKDREPDTKASQVDLQMKVKGLDTKV